MGGTRNNSASAEPAFEAGLALLLRLHELAMDGQNDTDNADGVRDELDAHWSRLRADDRRFLQDISADLQTLEPDYVKPRIIRWEDADFRTRLVRAHETKAWRDLLRLLRDEPSFLPEDRIMYMRGRALQQLGLPVVALGFFERAHALDPANVNYECLLLDALLQAGRGPEALRRAETMVGRAGLHPRLLLRAADVLFRSASSFSAEEQHGLYERTIAIISQALAIEEKLPPGERLPSVTQAGYVELALSHLRLGQRGEARKIYEKALELEPDNPTLLVTYAMLKHQEGEQDAHVYFAHAARIGTPLALPYMFLAHRALLRGQYVDTIHFAEMALERAAAGRSIADILEWKAIALASLARSPQEVEALLKTALTHDPTNERIERNLQRFLAAHGREAVSWTTEDAISFDGVEHELRPVLRMALAA